MKFSRTETSKCALIKGAEYLQLVLFYRESNELSCSGQNATNYHCIVIEQSPYLKPFGGSNRDRKKIVNWSFGVPRSSKIPVGFYVENAIPEILRSVPEHYFTVESPYQKTILHAPWSPNRLCTD